MLTEPCNFCEQTNSEELTFGFDMEWDAWLCWTCHLAQNTGLFMARYSVRFKV